MNAEPCAILRKHKTKVWPRLNSKLRERDNFFSVCSKVQRKIKKRITGYYL